jgi:hypothetical protein
MVKIQISLILPFSLAVDVVLIQQKASTMEQKVSSSEDLRSCVSNLLLTLLVVAQMTN